MLSWSSCRRCGTALIKSRSSAVLRYRSASLNSEQQEAFERRAKFKRSLDEFEWVDKITYSSFLSSYEAPHKSLVRLRNYSREEAKNIQKSNRRIQQRCTSLKYFQDDLKDDPEDVTSFDKLMKSNSFDGPIQYPFKKTDSINPDKDQNDEQPKQSPNQLDPEPASKWIHRYGVPDPNVPASDVPCCGCGAHLHCRDEGVPGYVPSQSFRKLSKRDLRSTLCQRCYYFKEHNAALNVNVSKEDYPRVLEAIKDRRTLVLLLVDLVDFPCSIWPGMAKILGDARPVILVGNKVDLLPQDSYNFLKHVKKCLYDVASSVGLCHTRIKHTALISAATGYGVEELITSIYKIWDSKADLFIMGCTNVGKSTLFNILLQSDLCKVQAVDLVHRATVSEWPGTTLNLLKFPVLKPSSYSMYLRNERMKQWQKEDRMERDLRNFQLRSTERPIYAQLIGRVGRSYDDPKKQEEIEFLNDRTADIFQVNPRSVNPPILNKVGDWDPEDEQYALGRWCYDTPGVVNENQILDVFILDELIRMLPKKLIKPRTFHIPVNHTMFLAGICRIDYVEGDKPIKFTVFSASTLPTTICSTEDAEEVYLNSLGTPIFGIPMGNPERLAQYPPMVKCADYELEGVNYSYSCGDVVISAVGWIAITGAPSHQFKISVHTPGGRGIFLRNESLLPHSVKHKGKRLYQSYAYGEHSLFIPEGKK